MRQGLTHGCVVLFWAGQLDVCRIRCKDTLGGDLVGVHERLLVSTFLCFGASVIRCMGTLGGDLRGVHERLLVLPVICFGVWVSNWLAFVS